jgi:hypothetical protein
MMAMILSPQDKTLTFSQQLRSVASASSSVSGSDDRRGLGEFASGKIVATFRFITSLTFIRTSLCQQIILLAAFELPKIPTFIDVISRSFANAQVEDTRSICHLGKKCKDDSAIGSLLC